MMEKRDIRHKKGLTEKITHYCPGCTHGIVHKIIGEVLVELDIVDKTIGVAPVGCAVLAYNYFNCDMQQAAHGRAPAVATGIKRVHPDKFVFTYQGDGDLASIGLAEVVHAAARGEKISTIFINNAIYGMTGGQMAPTTLLGQKTSTSTQGRTNEFNGSPIKVSELMSTIDNAVFVHRVSVDSPANIRKAKNTIKKCFQAQLNNEGYGIVEVLSTCPTNWGLTPVESLNWLRENMMDVYPLGIYRDGGN